MTIACRSARAEDRDFIVSGWSTSFRDAHAAGMIAMDDWATVMHRQISKVLDRSDVVTVIAHDPADDFLFGFISVIPRSPPVLDAPVVNYVYVKGTCRRRGIARALFASVAVDPSLPFEYTCRTSWVSHLADRIPRARCNPMPARFAEGEYRR